MSEGKRKPVPADQRDYELAREIDHAHTAPINAMTDLNNSRYSFAFRDRKPVFVEKDSFESPKGERPKPFPPPEQFAKKEAPADVKAIERELWVARKRIEIVEREKQQLVDDIKTLKKAYIELRDKPSDLKDLLDRRGFATVDELEKFILDAQESKRKARERLKRFEERHSY